MTSRRPSFAPNPRPSSAIYIGSEAIPPLPSPPSPARSTSSSRSQLPSPPATNSTGSIGDNNSTGTGSVRRLGMANGDEHPSLSDEGSDDNNDKETHDDDTAKLSFDRRAAKGKQPESSSSTIQRVRSLIERNRKATDRLTSTDPLSRPSFSASSNASSRSRSPFPPAFPSTSSSTTGSSSRVSLTGSFHGGSGSETEREREQRDPNPSRPSHSRSASSDDNDATTPPASSRPTPTFERAAPRQRLRSAPSPPPKPAVNPSPRKHTSTNFTVVGSGRRSRRVSIQQPGDEVEEEDESPTHHTISGNANKKTRAPLPREFRERRSLDGRYAGEPSNPSNQAGERNPSPGVFIARGSASANSSGAGGTITASPASPASPRSQRPARPSTVRESYRRSQRWSSVDDTTMNGDEEGRRQSRHGGSAESPLGGREGRSVVGEGLRAAGLARRGSEDVFVDGLPHRRARTNVNGTGTTGSREELDDMRLGIARDLGPGEETRDPRTPLTASSISTRFGISRNNTTIQSVLSGGTSRAGTSLGSYGADGESPRATSQPLRTHRTSYGPGARHTPQLRSSPAMSTFGRATPQHVSATPSSEHARLMLDSLAMFETQLARLPPGTLDLVRTAQSVVQSANGLNTLLRAGNVRALEAQIEAEVGDAAAVVDASEVWRKVGGEYRESVRVSDELVRSVTALLLGVGRLMREAVRERSSGSPDVGERGGGGERSSLDADSRESLRAQRRSMDENGRGSVEASVRDRDSRRSWDDGESSRMSQAEPNSRPSTALSMVPRERERPSALERLSIRRMFTPRSRESNQAMQDSPDPSYPSPSPAPRSSQDREPHRSLPPLSMPPPLPSLPSESLLNRKNSSQGRRAKLSSTSNATVRGSSIFPAMTSPRNPTTALTPHTVSAGAGEVMAFPILHSDPSSPALSGLQQQQQRDVRQRTVSATSLQETSESSSSSGTRALREGRVRMSLDGAEAPRERTPHTPAPHGPNGDRRERRKTINEIFP